MNILFTDSDPRYKIKTSYLATPSPPTRSDCNSAKSSVLEKNKRLLSMLISNLPGYVYRVHNDRNYTPVFVSSGVTAITGYTPEEYLVDRSISGGQEIDPNDADQVWQIIQQAIRDRQPYECEYRLKTKTGAKKWVRAMGQGIYSETDDLLFLEGFVTDITAQKQSAAKIAQQTRREQALSTIAQHIRDSLDIQEIVTTVTQQVKELMQCDRVMVFQLFPDGHRKVVEEAVSPEFISLKNRCWDREIWSQDILDYYWEGKPRIVADVMNDPWTDCLREYCREGQIQSKIVAPILQDRSKQKFDRWGTPLTANQLWGILVVYACQEKRVWEESEAQLLQQIANQLAIAMQQARLFEQLQQELKEKQQTEVKLMQSNQELARATRLKDEFLANMSHELRTPLNAILGMTEGLSDGVFGQTNSLQRKALSTIERSSLHLLELINDILDVAKIEAGHIDLDLAPTSVLRLCQSSLVFIKQQAVKKQIQISLDIAPHLPDLQVDERRIRQVLINLLSNAVKFTPSGGSITLTVTVKPDRFSSGVAILSETLPVSNQYLRLTITDTGIGISPQDLPRLFQPFVQIDSTLNRQYQGTGLGLALAKHFVELHGGAVGVSSEVGRGSTFTIDLPCHPPTSTWPQDRESSPPERIVLPGKPSPQILLAEDNEANIQTICSYLRAKGYQMLIAKNGREAIQMTQTYEPDLILMDIQMPDMDGLMAIQQIRQNPAFLQTPIIALTALAMKGDRERCLEAGANNYLAKPVKLKQLISCIQQLLRELYDSL